MSARARGYLAVTAAAALWGLSGVVAKVLFTQAVAPGALMAVRLTLAFAVGFLLVALTRPTALRQAWRHRLPIAVVGLAQLAGSYTYYVTVSLTTVATAIFLAYLAPVLLVLWERLVERRPLTPWRALAVAVAVAGSYLLVVSPRGLRTTPAGLLWGVGAAVTFAAHSLLARRQVVRVDPWAALVLALGVGALVMSLVAPPWRTFAADYTPTQWLLFTHLAVLATLVPFGLYLAALRHLSASEATLAAMLEPLVAAGAASVLLDEVLTPRQVLGGALVLLATGLIQFGPAPGRQPTPYQTSPPGDTVTGPAGGPVSGR